MKVYFLAYNLMNSSTADYFMALSNRLSLDHKVFVIAGKIRETEVKLNPQVTVLQWPSKRPSSWRDFYFLSKLVRRHRPDVMISIFSFVNPFLLVGWLFRVQVRVAWIRTLSLQYQQRQYKVLRKSFIYSLATDIITNSEATKNDVSRFFKIPPRKITILPNSVKDYKALVSDISIDKNNLLYVGRLHPSKGVDVLIQAFAQIVIKYPGLQLDIIGQGPSLNQLEELTKSLEISDKVLFLGEKNKTSVLQAYKKSYCTIVPSHSEAFGFTVIEAMSVGTCVIGANNTGIKEIIIHEDTGLLFKTGNADDLVNKLDQVLPGETFRNRLANKGYERFVNYYDVDYATDRDFNFLDGL